MAVLGDTGATPEICRGLAKLAKFRGSKLDASLGTRDDAQRRAPSSRILFETTDAAPVAIAS
jgi:hypothetical protein